MHTIKGTYALVTGASSGIGKAFAEQLAQRGAHLVLVARSEDTLQAIAARLRQQFQIQVLVIATDLSQPGAARAIYERTEQEGITIHLLINNAGFGKIGQFLDYPPDVYHEMLTLNMLAVVELCQFYLPAMLTRGDGGIINVASIGGFLPVPYSAVYAATKAFVLHFTEGLYGEYHQQGVNILALCPGGTASNFATVAFTQIPEGRERQYDAPEMVVARALDALIRDRPVVVTGRMSRLVTTLPRFLSRRRVIAISGNSYRRVLKRRSHSYT